MLGTGNALVTECYNTCFVLSDEYGHFLVDGGGGNTVLSQLKKAGIDLMDVHEIFVTHKHVDHIMGIVWVIRIICQNMKKGTYQGEANIYAHDEVIGLLKDMAFKLLNKKETQYIGDRLHLIEVKDGEERTILNKKVTFFDIGSTKAKQFGFQMIYDGGKYLPAVAMSHTTSARRNTPKAATGCSTKHSACTDSVISSILMRNITPQSRMPASLLKILA